MQILFSEPYQRWVALLLSLSQQAGAAIVDHYNSADAAQHSSKQDNSPLTQADLASHEILAAGLLPTGISLLSEESSESELLHRGSWPRCWMVDPLDGTKEFLGRTGEFTINIALIEAHRAALGVIAVPLRPEVYMGVPGEGAWKWSASGWEAITTRALDPQRPLSVLTSRRHRGDVLQAYLTQLQAHPAGLEMAYSGSALKFCSMAEGTGDVYPRFAPCSEWDTAAGEALLQAAGGDLRTPEGGRFCYNQRDSLLNGDFIAIADPQHSFWQSDERKPVS